jgi:acyl carrier protein
MPDVFTIVVDLVEQVTDVPAEEIDGDVRFDTLDSWTSFAALQLLTAIEDRFEIRLDLRGYLACAHVEQLVSSVRGELAGAPAAGAESDDAVRVR